MPKVFLSYSHDNEPHRQRVLAFANRLRVEGVDCVLDRYESFPAEGWPKWTARQIREAAFVLVACTEAYARRVRGQEEPGLGLGATWEGQIITQAVYESGGRNTKFVPILFDEADARQIPDFLLPASRFNVSRPAGYEALYRLLTQQPAVLRPALGTIRMLPTEGEAPTEPFVEPGRVLSERSGPTIVWRLPRGFVLLEDLEPQHHPSWATIASYYDYSGGWIQSTHFHKSYRWRESHDGIDRQCAKLGIPRADWRLAHAPIEVMMLVREGHMLVSHDGYAEGHPLLDKVLATVHPPGNVYLPTIPPQYRRLAASGQLRDLAAEADDLIRRATGRREPSEPWLPDLDEDVRRLRREVRVEVHRMLSEGHPAVRNVDEIIEGYCPGASNRMPWLREFGAAIHEAAQCVEEQSD